MIDAGEEIETLVVKVRADTRDFARGVGEMQGLVDGTLATGVERAGHRMEAALARFVRTGKFGFEDLKRTALAVLQDVARAQVRGLLGGGGSGGNGGGLLGSLLGGALSSFAGLPGRATGGPVAPGQAYLVGERGPELFVPTASGRVETGAGSGAGSAGGAVTINVNVAQSAASPAIMQKSARQVAQAVRRSLEQGR